MIDQNSQFFAILTNVGVAKQAKADALGTPWKITQMGVGDANGTDPQPSATQTTLINERRRAPLNQLKVDPANAAIIIAEQVIPEDVGGWWIREIGLYDADNDLVAVANCAPSFKPLLVQGSGRTQVVRMNMIVSNSSNVELKIDPSVVLATRAYVDAKVLEELNKQDFKYSVLVATTAAITLSGVQTIDGIAVPDGSRVLVKNQAAAKDNGIYLSATGAWSRAADADASVEVTPGLFVHVEQGTLSGDSVWQLVTDAPIVLGTTSLTFEMISGRTGIGAGTYRSVTVDKYGRVMAGTNPTTLAAYGITDAQPLDPELSALAAISVNGLLARTAAGTAAARSIAAGAGVSVSNGDAVAGNPTVSLSVSGITAGTYPKLTVDQYGRATAGAVLAAADIPALDWTKIGSGKPTTLGGYGITDAQPLDADLTALAALVATGLYANTGPGTAAARSIATGAGLSVSNGDGVAGNPTLTNTGVLSVAGTANQVTVSGATGNVVFSLPQSIHSGATPSWAQINLAADPTAALHCATKQYVDNLMSGLDVKTSVLVATTANITLSGTQTIDGIAVTAGARVLVKNQTTASQNGLYLCAAGAWTRSTDADTWNELVSAFVFVERGSQNSDTGWVCIVDPGGTLGTTNVTVSQFAGAGTVTGGAGIAVVGNQVALTVSGVVAGTYPNVTVDQYGRVTAGAPLVAADIPALDWAKITSGKPTTLGGYGITLPTQLQAEAGADNTLPMTPLRVFQAIAKVVAQATEVAFGWAKVATQAQTNAGADDTTMVTPKKLRFGFAVSFNAQGYVVFPSWLGSLIIQWTSSASITPGATGAAYWPIAFPNACIWALAAPMASSGNSNAGNIVAGDVSAVAVNLYNWGSAISAPSRVIAIGV